MKNNFKKFSKPLDNCLNVWYNIGYNGIVCIGFSHTLAHSVEYQSLLIVSVHTFKHSLTAMSIKGCTLTFFVPSPSPSLACIP